MGVAEQMLLNQVTIFNPPSSSTRSSYETSSTPKIKAGSTPLIYGDVPRTPSDYAFGWKDPRDIVEEK
jgi:hypothetical protein